MSKHYEPEFKNRIVRLHLEDGRTLIVLLTNTVFRAQALQTG